MPWGSFLVLLILYIVYVFFLIGISASAQQFPRNIILPSGRFRYSRGVGKRVIAASYYHYPELWARSTSIDEHFDVPSASAVSEATSAEFAGHDGCLELIAPLGFSVPPRRGGVLPVCHD